MRYLLLFIASMSLLLNGCGGTSSSTPANKGGDTLRYAYASLLLTIEHPGYTRVDIRDPWHPGQTLARYALVARGVKGDSLVKQSPWGEGVSVVRVPLRQAVVFTSAHCALFQELGAETCVAGVCDKPFNNLAWIKGNKKIADCGSSVSPDVERIVDIKADALLVSPFQDAHYERLTQTGIPLILLADYMETSPLGRAEWMRFYGRLVGKTREADSLFQRVDSIYQGLRAQARRLPKGRSLLTERKTGSVWYCPGGRSTIGQLLADAHTGYPFARDTHAGSLPLSPEQVMEQADSIDVWAFKVNDSDPLSYRWLLEEYAGYASLKAFRQREVYACPVNATLFFEEQAFHPEHLLRDFILLSHPGALPGKLRYFRRLHE